MAEYIELNELQKFCREYSEVDAVGLILADRTDLLHTADVIPIPEGATNGDMIKAMFPNELLTSITGTLWLGDNMSFNKDWWNAHYKREVKKYDSKRIARSFKRF